jgi:LysR family glycine cleavage system transcriptional activator
VLPDLESLRCFTAAADTLNFRAAARLVGLTPAAVGQRISRLEELLGVRLFDRTTRRVELTEAGLALLPKAREALDAARDCVRAARGDLGPPPLELVVGTRHELGLSWVEPMLGDLEARFPHITFHLYFGSGSDLTLRLLGQEIDCAIHSRRVTEPGIDSTQLHREDYVLVAAPGLLERAPFRGPADATAHVLLDTQAELPLFRYLKESPLGDQLMFHAFRRMGTIAAIRAAVLRGAGVAVLPRYLVHDDLDAGDLVRLMPEVPLESDFFRLLFRAGDPRAPTFRALAEAMVTHPLR